MKTHFEYDIFISYSSADVTLAEALETLLRGKGLKVWRDKSDCGPAITSSSSFPGRCSSLRP